MQLYDADCGCKKPGLGFIDLITGGMALLSAAGKDNSGMPSAGGAPGNFVSTNVNTTVSPQISPQFIQQQSPTNSPINAGINTPVTGAMPGFDTMPAFAMPGGLQQALLSPVGLAAMGLIAFAVFASSRKGGARRARKNSRRGSR